MTILCAHNLHRVILIIEELGHWSLINGYHFGPRRPALLCLLQTHPDAWHQATSNQRTNLSPSSKSHKKEQWEEDSTSSWWTCIVSLKRLITNRTILLPKTSLVWFFKILEARDFEPKQPRNCKKKFVWQPTPMNYPGWSRWRKATNWVSSSIVSLGLFIIMAFYRSTFNLHKDKLPDSSHLM